MAYIFFYSKREKCLPSPELIVCLFLHLSLSVFVLGEEFWIAVTINISAFHHHRRLRRVCRDKLFCTDCNMYPHASRLCRLISVNISGLSYIKTLLWRFKHPKNNYVRFLFTCWHPEPTIKLRDLVKKTLFCILLCSKLGI